MLACEMGRARAGEQELRNSAGGTAKSPDLTVAPGLVNDPLDGVVAIPMVRPTIPLEREIIPLRTEAPARVLNDCHIAVARPVFAGAGGDRLVVRCSCQQHRENPVCRGEEYVSAQLDAVAHRHGECLFL